MRERFEASFATNDDQVKEIVQYKHNKRGDQNNSEKLLSRDESPFSAEGERGLPFNQSFLVSRPLQAEALCMCVRVCACVFVITAFLSRAGLVLVLSSRLAITILEG